MPHKDPHLLTDLVVEENSLVPAGANPGAKVILTKSECDKMETKAERNQLMANLIKYLNTDVSDIVKLLKGGASDNPEGDDVSKELEALQKSMAAQGAVLIKMIAKSAVGELVLSAIDAIAKAADSAAIDAILVKANTDLVEAFKTNEIDDADLLKSSTADVEKNLGERAKARKTELDNASSTADLKKFRDELPEALQKSFDGMSSDDKAKFMKSFGKSADDDPVAKALETVTKANISLQKQVDQLTGDSVLAKALAEFEDLKGVVKLEEWVPNVLKLRKHDTDAADALVASTRALAKQAKEGGLFKLLGHGGNDGFGDADSELNKAIKKYRADHSDCESDEVAATKVMEANPELYTNWNDEQSG